MPSGWQSLDDLQVANSSLFLHLAQGGFFRCLSLFDMSLGKVGDAFAHDADEFAVFHDDSTCCRSHSEGLFQGLHHGIFTHFVDESVAGIVVVEPFW